MMAKVKVRTGKAQGAAKVGTYSAVLPAMKSMTETELLAAIEAELNSENPRTEMLTRLVGRFNKARGQRFTTGVLSLLGARGRRDVASLL
jgi:hypothetical protein